MQNLKLILTASVVLGTTAAATMNSAEARRYRHVVVNNDYLVSEASCSIVPPSLSSYIFPAANWEPFFRCLPIRPDFDVCAIDHKRSFCALLTSDRLHQHC
jgi:hypothetical protein